MAEREEEIDEVDADYDPEAEVTDAKWKRVDLPEMPVVTGEEDDDLVAKFRSKLYRFRNGEWKERGTGDLKILKNKQNSKIRLLMRAEKTHKIVTNHLLQKKGPLGVLEPLKTSNNSWTWIAYDISDETPQTEKLCAKFTSKEEYERFQVEFGKAVDHNNELGSKTENKTESKPEEKKVEEKKTEEAPVEKKE